jgi:hypothetical protein
MVAADRFITVIGATLAQKSADLCAEQFHHHPDCVFAA